MSFIHAFSFKRNAKALVTPPKTAHHIGPLDGLRALGAVWVVAFHAFQLMPSVLVIPDEEGKQRFARMANSFFMRGVNNGELGVDIFFILSGFLIMSILRRDLTPLVMCHSFADEETKWPLAEGATSEERKPSVGRAIARFFIRRYFRIMPVYALALIFGIVIEVFFPSGTMCRSYVWRNLLFIQNFFPTADMCLVWTWSIAVEWQMYMVSPLVVWAVLRWPHRSRLLLFALGFTSLVLYIALRAYDEVVDPAYFNDVWVVFMPYTRVFAYFVGMLVAIKVEKFRPRSPSQVGPTTETNAVIAPLTIKAIVLRCVSILAVLLSALCTSTMPDQNYGWKITQTLFTRPVFVFGLAYIMYDMLVPRGAPGSDLYQETVNSILSSRPLYFLAQVSYGVYLFHVFGQGLFLIFNGPLAAGSIDFYPQWIYPVTLVLILLFISALSSIIALLIEKPAINLASNILLDPVPSGDNLKQTP